MLPGGVESGFGFDVDTEAALLEVQQQYRRGRLSLISGAGYYERSDNLVMTFKTAMVPFPVIETTSEEKNQVNVYLYAHTHFPDSVTWTVGGDYSRYDDGEKDGGQFNPKIGAVWQISDKTSLHAAFFRTLMRMLPATNQTIEPTQIAGFNQFFNDHYGTDSWHYGLGVDHTFSPSLYGGLEFFKRDIEFPFDMVTVDPPTFSPVTVAMRSEWIEKTSRAYLYWTPSSKLSTALEVFHEDYDRDANFGNPSGFSKMDIYRVPLSVHYFHPEGLMAGMKGTYLEQEGEFGDPGYGFIPGSDRFWVVDAMVGYRLPKRLGVITLDVRNLFDASFQFQDSDPANPATVPERMVMGRITLSY